MPDRYSFDFSLLDDAWWFHDIWCQVMRAVLRLWKIGWRQWVATFQATLCSERWWMRAFAVWGRAYGRKLAPQSIHGWIRSWVCVPRTPPLLAWHQTPSERNFAKRWWLHSAMLRLIGNDSTRHAACLHNICLLSFRVTRWILAVPLGYIGVCRLTILKFLYTLQSCRIIWLFHTNRKRVMSRNTKQRLNHVEPC